MKHTLGIDPGAGGAMALFAPQLQVYPFAGYADTVERIKEIAQAAKTEGAELVVYLENPPFFSGKNGAAIAKLQRNTGIIEGTIRGLGITLNLVPPQLWQKGISGTVGTKGAARKRALKEACALQFPQVKATLKNCDAILIADWGRKQP